MEAVPIAFPLDGTGTLRGHRYRAGQREAVLVHDGDGDLDDWTPLVPVLLEEGTSVLSFDLPGHGLSDGRWDPARSPAAVRAALDVARSDGAESLALVGAGVGAAAAIVAAGNAPVEAVVALSPRAPVPELAGEALREARAPKLIICGGLDKPAAEEAREVFRLVVGAKLLEPFPVQEQGVALIEGSWGDHVVEQILSFLRFYL